jgi:DNA-binding CsgD family transcriptional regulator/tetratricopeptide (TPR) repeat protein
VRDAVLGRVARLSAAARAAVEMASIEPAGLERSALEACLGGSDAALAECEERAVLRSADGRLRFRHELARLAVVEAITESRRVALHRALLEALRSAPAGVSLARLAHHAEGAQLPEAVLEYATAAARACVAVNAHREAVQHFARALLHTRHQPDDYRAAMLEEYAWQCQLIGSLDAALAARGEALETWRRRGDREREAVALATQSGALVGAGRNAEARLAIEGALAAIRGTAPTRGHGYVHRQHAYVCMLERDVGDAIEGAKRAIALAERFDDTETLVHAYNTIGSSLLVSDDMAGIAPLCKAKDLAAAHGFDYLVSIALGNLGSACGEVHRYREAQGYLEEGVAYALRHDLDQARFYQQSWLALVHLHRGRWNEAAGLAQQVLDHPGTSAIARIMALLCIARLRTRRGDPGAWDALDQAMALAGGTRTLQRLAPVCAARAEAAWLDGEAGGAAREAEAGYALALDKRHAWFAGELAYWQWKGGRVSEAPSFGASAFTLQIEGRWKEAAAEWNERDCPYESARALAEGDVAAQMEALAVFERLGARPAAARVRHALRSAGVKRIPRGPRPSTRENALGVTRRELEILACLAEGLTNAEIGARLHISAKTVDHHVGALLGKLGVGSRRQAARAAADLGLLTKMG